MNRDDWVVTDWRNRPDWPSEPDDEDLPISIEWTDAVADPNFEQMVDDNQMQLTLEQAIELRDRLNAVLPVVAN